ncbi:MAG: type II toxin-antitoxin system VapC family toxin [SAR324 cluster bacterium]|nr:type II toxin-antitoxin system VapC family toxin [SAR324 cluster bacterium]
MKYLLDTHSFLWWILDSPALSAKARNVIGNAGNDIFWSVASSWEVAIKHNLGRLPLPAEPSIFITGELNRIDSIPITNDHAYQAGKLPPHHKDPFDRMLISQSKIENLQIITADKVFRQYDVKTIW